MPYTLKVLFATPGAHQLILVHAWQLSQSNTGFYFFHFQVQGKLSTVLSYDMGSMVLS